jgi:uncharacterized protein (TIGR00255 family)
MASDAVWRFGEMVCTHAARLARLYRFNLIPSQPHLVSTLKPVQSMTGYASVYRELPSVCLSLELRAVNARFLDLVVKIPDELRSAEPPLREMLAGTLRRGKLELRTAFQRRTSADRQLTVDHALLIELARISNEVRARAPDAAPMTVAELLRWPGVLGDERMDSAALNVELLSMADQALAEFIASRIREGTKLAQAILERVEGIEEIVAKLGQTAPDLLTSFEDKLTERLRMVLIQSSNGSSIPVEETFARVRQEITAYGLRIDVSEELSRLSAHASEVRRVLRQGAAVGKRLDFLMQELNREANTLGSKSATAAFSTAAMELKLLIEQMREQVQNIE